MPYNRLTSRTNTRYKHSVSRTTNPNTCIHPKSVITPGCLPAIHCPLHSATCLNLFPRVDRWKDIGLCEGCGYNNLLHSLKFTVPITGRAVVGAV